MHTLDGAMFLSIFADSTYILHYIYLYTVKIPTTGN